FVRVFTLLHCAATTFCRIEQFTCQTQVHGFLATLFSGFTQPAHCQLQTAHGADLNRDLVVGTAHAAAFNFNCRLDVVDGQVEHFDRFFTCFGLDLIQCTINDALCNSFFTGEHDNVDEFCQFNTTKLW